MDHAAPPPPPMADLTGPIVKSAAVIAAGQLGLFHALAESPRSAAELATLLGAGETGVLALTETLASVGYLERVGDRYANGPIARAWLTPSSPVDFSAFLLWGAEVWQLLEDLAQCIRRGQPQRTMYQVMAENPTKGQIFAQYMKATARLLADPIAQCVALPPTARRLLDLGGSHGLYSIALCRRYPHLRAVIFDLPVALTEAEATIRAEGMAGRVRVEPGDYLTGSIGQDWDVVLCFNLLHNHTEAQNRALLTKAAGALAAGGLLVIHDFVRPDPPDPFNAAFSLIMFNQNGTRTYRYTEMAAWLEEAGLHDIRRIDLPPAGQSSLVTAVKAS